MILCWLFGHKPMRLPSGRLPYAVRDILHFPIIGIELCERCKTVYWEGL
jgi:hypothetical protein